MNKEEREWIRKLVDEFFKVKESKNKKNERNIKKDRKRI